MAEYSGYAATLQVDNSGYTTIGQVRDITGPSMALDAIDSTHRSTSGAWKTALPGQIDGGEVTFDIAYDPDLATHSAAAAPGLVYYMINRTVKSFKINFPDTTPATATFSGFVTKFTPKEPQNDLLTADVTIKVAGAITWA